MPGEAMFAAGLLDPAAPVPQYVACRTPRRYAIYRNNVTVGLVRALEANFPAVRHLLGDTYYSGLARDFAQRHPPSSPLLFRYGEVFAAYLSAQDDLAEYPYLADVARLEQLWRLAYHAADAGVLHPTELNLPPEQLMSLRLEPHPATAILASPYAVHAIFTANRREGGFVDDPGRPESVLVTRPQLDVLVTPLSPAHAVFLSALVASNSLADAAEQGFAATESFDLADAIRLMVEAGVFHRLILQDPS